MKQKRENVIRPRLYRQLTRKEPIQSAEKTISSVIGTGKTGPLQAKE